MIALGNVLRAGLLAVSLSGAYWALSRVKTSYDARNKRALKYSTVQGRRGVLYGIGYSQTVKLDPENLGLPVPADAIKVFQNDWIRLAKKAEGLTGEVPELLGSVDLEPTGQWSDETFEALEKANKIVNLSGQLFPKVEI